MSYNNYPKAEWFKNVRNLQENSFNNHSGNNSSINKLQKTNEVEDFFLDNETRDDVKNLVKNGINYHYNRLQDAIYAVEKNEWLQELARTKFNETLIDVFAGIGLPFLGATIFKAISKLEYAPEVIKNMTQAHWASIVKSTISPILKKQVNNNPLSTLNELTEIDTFLLGLKSQYNKTMQHLSDLVITDEFNDIELLAMLGRYSKDSYDVYDYIKVIQYQLNEYKKYIYPIERVNVTAVGQSALVSEIKLGLLRVRLANEINYTPFLFKEVTTGFLTSIYFSSFFVNSDNNYNGTSYIAKVVSMALNKADKIYFFDILDGNTFSENLVKNEFHKSFMLKNEHFSITGLSLKIIFHDINNNEIINNTILIDINEFEISKLKF